VKLFRLEKIADAHDLFAALASRYDFESGSVSKKTIGHWRCPSRERRQNWIVLQHESDQTIWTAAVSNCWAAFQNASTFIARCRLSRYFSPAGSTTDPPLRFDSLNRPHLQP